MKILCNTSSAKRSSWFPQSDKGNNILQKQINEKHFEFDLCIMPKKMKYIYLCF